MRQILLSLAVTIILVFRLNRGSLRGALQAGLRLCAPVAAMLALCGCESAGGITREARLKAIPDLACVEQAIAHTPGVTNLKHTHEGRWDQYTYTSEGVTVWLIIEPKKFGGAGYYHTYVLLNRDPPSELLAHLRSDMRSVDEAVEESCHVTALRSGIDESCPTVHSFFSKKCP